MNTQAPKPATATAAPAPAAETKGDKFKRLAVVRVDKALDSIAAIGGLSAKNNYEYTEAQVDKIEAALKAEIEVLVNRFRKPEAAAKSGFSL